MEYIGPSLFAIGKHLITGRKELANTLLKISECYGPVVHFRVGQRHVFLVSGPDSVRHILQENQHNYLGFRRSHQSIRPLLGNGLLTSNGELWRRHRRIAQQAFYPKQIQILSTTIIETTQKFLTIWESNNNAGKTVDIGEEMYLLTLYVVSAALFGIDIGDDAFVIKTALLKIIPYLTERLLNPLAIPAWFPNRKNYEYHTALESLNRIVQQLISKGRTLDVERTSIMRMLIAPHDKDSGSPLDDQELRDEIMTILIAGHETCANALTWTFYMLALNPDIQEHLALEVQEVMNGRPPTYENLPQLHYAHMVFNEVLRLYPPAWIMARDVVDQDVIGGVLIPPGSLVFLSPYINHHMSSLWEEPACFDPLRFSPERLSKIPRFAYFPFGGGQRLCLGKNFAMVEAVLIISMMVQRYKFSPSEANLGVHTLDKLIPPALDMSPKLPVLLKLERRSSHW